MHIQYSIVEFNKDTGSVLVKYFCDELPEGVTYNVDIPVINGQLAPQADVDALILALQPTAQIERLVALKTAEIPGFLAEKIPAPVVIEQPLEDPPVV